MVLVDPNMSEFGVAEVEAIHILVKLMYREWTNCSCLWITASIFAITTWITLSLRLYVRLRIIKRYGWDDITICLSQVLFSGFCVCNFGAYVCISGPIPTSWSNLKYTASYVMAGETLYIWAILMLKYSVASFLLRFDLDKWQKRTIYFILVISSIMSVAFTGTVLMACGIPLSPTTYIMRSLLNRCWPRNIVLSLCYSHAALTAVSDLVFACIPLHILLGSMMKKRDKIIAYILSSSGTVSVVVSLARFKFVPAMAYSNVSFLEKSTILAALSTAEAGIGITAVCLSSLRRLYDKIAAASFFKRFKGSTPEITYKGVSLPHQ